MQVFLPNSFRIKHFERKKRVRDWKGYGIVQQCGTCEPLQSPTDVALEMSGAAEVYRNAKGGYNEGKVLFLRIV